jgi:hypothetical protein
MTIWFLGIGFFFLFKYLSDKQKPFEEYLKPELESKGLKFISSVFFRATISEMPFNVEDKDVSISYIVGGKGAVQFNVYSTYRKVVFEDTKGKRQEVLASLDFKSFISRKLKRIRWKPSLDSFCS